MANGKLCFSGSTLVHGGYAVHNNYVNLMQMHILVIPTVQQR